MEWTLEKIEQAARTAITNPFIAAGLLALLFVVIYLSPEDEEES